MLPFASAALAAAVLLVLQSIPHEPISRVAPAAGPSVIDQALAKPKQPTLGLELPDEVATEIPPLRVDGIYGPARPQPMVRSFRTREANALVIVAMLPDGPAVYRPADAGPDALSVHGAYAANYSVEATSLTAVRWTEHGVTYEIASRNMLLADLLRIAERVY